MSRLLSRLIAIFMIPGLLVDPALAAAAHFHNVVSRTTVSAELREVIFSAEAFSPPEVAANSFTPLGPVTETRILKKEAEELRNAVSGIPGANAAEPDAPDIRAAVAYLESLIGKPIPSAHQTQIHFIGTRRGAVRGLYSPIKHRFKRPGGELYTVPEEFGRLLAYVQAPAVLNPDVVTGLVGFALHAEDQYGQEERPAVWALIYTTGGKTSLRVRDAIGHIHEEVINPIADRRPAENVWLSYTEGIVTLQNDLLLPGYSIPEIRRFAQHRLRFGVTPKRGTSERNLGVQSFGTLGTARIVIPEEHRSGGSGTPLSLYFNGFKNSRDVLIAPFPAVEKDILTGTPFALVRRLPSGEFEIIGWQGVREKLQINSSAKKPSLALTQSQIFRSLLRALTKKWRFGPIPLSISLGDRMSFNFALATQAYMVRRPDEVSITEGRENNQLLVIDSDSPLLNGPLEDLTPKADPAPEVKNDLSLLQAIEQAPGGVLHVSLTPVTLDQIEKEAVIRFRLPAEDSGEIEVLMKGAQKPLFILKTFLGKKPSSQSPSYFNVNVLLLLSEGIPSDPLGVRSYPPLLTKVAVPRRWYRVTTPYVVLQWQHNEPPWVIREEELPAFEAQRKDLPALKGQPIHLSRYLQDVSEHYSSPDTDKADSTALGPPNRYGEKGRPEMTPGDEPSLLSHPSRAPALKRSLTDLERTLLALSDAVAQRHWSLIKKPLIPKIIEILNKLKSDLPEFLAVHRLAMMLRTNFRESRNWEEASAIINAFISEIRKIVQTSTGPNVSIEKQQADPKIAA